MISDTLSNSLQLGPILPGHYISIYHIDSVFQRKKLSIENSVISHFLDPICKHYLYSHGVLQYDETKNEQQITNQKHNIC